MQSDELKGIVFLKNNKEYLMCNHNNTMVVLINYWNFINSILPCLYYLKNHYNVNIITIFQNFQSLELRDTENWLYRKIYSISDVVIMKKWNEMTLYKGLGNLLQYDVYK